MTRVCFILMLIALSTCSVCNGEISPGKLFKYFMKLDQHLEKNVDNYSPPELMRETEFLLEAKLSQCITFCDKSYIETLKMLTKLKALSTDQYDCVFYKERAFLELIDSGLKDSSRQKNPNYRRTAVDRMIEYYVFRAFEHCGFKEDVELPRLNIALMQSAYDWINDRLEEQLPGDYNVGRNMEAISDLLRKQTSAVGVLTEAMEQFLMLRRTTKYGSCNVEGYDIILKNALALRGLYDKSFVDEGSMRRINRIYKYFATEREKMCYGGFHRSFALAVEKNLHWLDPARRVLGLASSFYLETKDYKKLVESLEGNNEDTDYTVPLMIEYAKGILETSTEPMLMLPKITNMDINKIRDYVKALYLADGNKWFRGGSALDFKYVAINAGNDNGEKLFGQYLFIPCKFYMEDIGRLVEANEFEAYANKKHFRTSRGEFLHDLKYYMVRAGYHACKYVLLNEKYILY